MDSERNDGQKQESLNLTFNYTFFFWLLFSVVVFKLTLFDYLDDPSGADEVVMKRQLPQGDWLYITRYLAPATDLNTLRFYISKRLEGSDSQVLKRLNEDSLFLLTDSELSDVKITDTPNGVGVEVTGAVYSYFSKQYITEGETLKSYRITLNQRDVSPPHR
ncbi:hypothetical protein K0038_04007 [Pseudomonas syringae]|uniref:hypothetical protein n=1 Tax=Pseudomonas syringae TaxID=317 RepID=UPI001CA8BEAF|nr:hypothetical protein [Pseudomonas syringae]